jgi:hypothetical protein
VRRLTRTGSMIDGSGALRPSLVRGFTGVLHAQFARRG